jgi:hypothetical protein
VIIYATGSKGYDFDPNDIIAEYDLRNSQWGIMSIKKTDILE